MKTILLSPRILILLLSLLFLLLPTSPNSNLQASFAPPIEPVQQQPLQPILPKTTKTKKKKKPITTFTAKQKYYFGTVAIAVAIALVLAIIVWAVAGLYYIAIVNFFAPHFLDVGAWIIFCLMLLGVSTILALPALLYGRRLIKNSKTLPEKYDETSWPALKKEYIWGIIASSILLPAALLLAIFGALFAISLLLSLSFSYIATLLLPIGAVYFLIRCLIYNIKKYHQDKPSNQPKATEPTIDEYK